MCGLTGVIGSPLPTERTLVSMRDALTHRGPDDAGLWIGDGAALAHRRLAVIDPGPAGHQPMATPDASHVIAYNGEIYNDQELRLKLAGLTWRSACDTETLLRWLASGGGWSEVRGMYAVAVVDTHRRTLTLARDPLGIKPLYWARLPGRVVFASEPQALFEHPELSPRPDPLGVSLYLSSLRPAMASRTLFQGVCAVEPGQALTFSIDDPSAQPAVSTTPIAVVDQTLSDHEVGSCVTGSIVAHLRSDVSLCAMLSGGLDSTIIALEAAGRVAGLRTYCAGADAESGDPAFASTVASRLGTTHRTLLLDEPTFTREWLDTIDRTGLPLSTPNEVAIRLIARAMRSDGHVVTLSGEGADELFAGYDRPLAAAAANASAAAPTSGGRFELESNAWVPSDLKPALLAAELASEVGDDAGVIDLFESQFSLGVDELGSDASEIEAHLRFQRRVNLPALLHRLDTSTMLESVEGRTPFADAEVAACAASIPFARLCDIAQDGGRSRTKLPLRSAFAASVPRAVMRRDKSSFPVPFDAWMGGVASIVGGSETSWSLFQPAMLRAATADPGRTWHLAWPLLNLCAWAERWWGRGLASAVDQARAASIRGTAESSRFV
ncbi:MAG: asparagine synthase (glutamine-hydrolyzing) [Planctomycetota bacterium]